MNLPELLDRAFRRLFDHYVQLEEENGRARQSLQAPFEAQMKQLQYSSRHRAARYVVRTEFGLKIEHRRGNDLACGCDAHCYHPTPQGGRDYDGPDVHLDRRPDSTASALRALDEQTQFRLARLARVMLPRHMVVFGPPFKLVGGERYIAPLAGVAKEPSRGPGTIAETTDMAVRLFGARAPAALADLGERIYARAATEQDRDLARALRRQAEDAAVDALTQLAEAMKLTPRLPTVVRRAGQRERAAA